MEFKCQICNRIFNNRQGLINHINRNEKITSKDYYDKYIKIENEGKCKTCGNISSFISIVKGYRTYCTSGCIIKDKDIQAKIKKTNLERYGAEYTVICDSIKEKTKQTNLEKYGVDNVFKLKTIQAQIKNTNLEKYGVVYPQQSTIINQKTREHILDSIFSLDPTERLKGACFPNFTREEYKGGHLKYEWVCAECDNIFTDHLGNGHIPRCKVCYPIITGISNLEKEVSDFCKQYYPNLIENDRRVIYPYELDVYIPEINLAVEFNGLYWHTETSGGKNSTYHLNKYLLCKEKNIQLIHIFEDEWINKEHIIKSILLNKMKKTTIQINGRNCQIKLLDKNTANLFYNNNHIQGSVYAKYNIGLYHKDVLVSCLSVGKSRYNKHNQYEILRFCNKLNMIVQGSLNKLCNYFITTYSPDNIITYSDLRFDDGAGYLNCHFKFIEKSQPNYYYYYGDGKKRESCLKYQKCKLKTLLKTYNPELTEKENMVLNGYDVIYDCGNNVYTWNNI